MKEISKKAKIIVFLLLFLFIAAAATATVMGVLYGKKNEKAHA